jgi:steroid 5-alpha reductase family enzyme
MATLKILILGFIISLVLTSIGFKKTVWFISIGYTLTIVVLSILTLIFHHSGFHFFNYLQVLLLFIWGSRLGFYIIQRESNINYNSSVKEQTGSSQLLPVTVKTGIWVSVSFLYVCMFSPAIFAIQETSHSSILVNILTSLGLLVMLTGIIIEGIADSQKWKFKTRNPGTFCNTGLYKWVRCPNYLGEIMVWLGNFLIASSFCNTWWQWAISTTGLVAILLIMMGSAKRLEKKQSFTYGKDPEFQEYEKSVPILFPWTRLYSLQNVKVYLE